jgi:hypothetical protein
MIPQWFYKALKNELRDLLTKYVTVDLEYYEDRICITLYFDGSIIAEAEAYNY